MSGFWASLGANLAALPRNLRAGLRPGRGGEGEPSARPRLRRAFVYHLHPLQVRERSLAPWATLGLGLTGLTLVLLLGLTGILLMIYYVPTTREALASIQDLDHAVVLGRFVRALHRWAGHGLVAVVGLHLVRVIATAGYHRRGLNWLLGLLLLLLTLGLAFTGYLLPWDQLAYWAVTVSTRLLDHVPLIGGGLKQLLLGGDVVGQAALSRFYVLHVALLPSLVLLLGALHLWRLRKDGGLAVATTPEAPDPRVPAWPHLVLREAILILLVLAACALVALLVDAPLGGPADPHHPSNPEKTPWYFLWLQEMVSYSAVVGGVLFPGLVLLGLLLLPGIEREPAGVGRWLGGRAGRRAVLVSLVVGAGVLAAAEALYLSSGGAAWRAAASPAVQDLCNPASLMLVLAALACVAAGSWSGSTRAGILAAATVILVAVVGFSLIATCRGPDWVFYWPWEAWPVVD